MKCIRCNRQANIEWGLCYEHIWQKIHGEEQIFLREELAKKSRECDELSEINKKLHEDCLNIRVECMIFNEKLTTEIADLKHSIGEKDKEIAALKEQSVIRNSTNILLQEYIKEVGESVVKAAKKDNKFKKRKI